MDINNMGRYKAEDKMMSLIATDYRIINVMTRFGMRMGFGEATVGDVCEMYGVDCATFLAVVNFIADGFVPKEVVPTLSPRTILDYLKRSHSYFLEYLLPAIRRKLLDGIQVSANDVSFLILKFFDDYTSEVAHHMDYEEQTVFCYIDALLRGRQLDGYKISTFSDHHEEVVSKLRELKQIIICYSPGSTDPNLLNAALYDIYRCGDELWHHSQVEDHVLVPVIEELERNISRQEAVSGSDDINSSSGNHKES